MADGLPVYSAALCEHRTRLGLTQREVAEELARLAYERGGSQARRGVNTEMVSRWERGVKRPGPYYQELLCLLFGATPAQLGFRSPLPAESSGHDGGRYDEAVDGTRSAREEEDVKRRRFLELLAAAALAPLDHQLEGMRRGFDASLAREPLLHADVDEWERTAYAYSCEAVTVAPGQLLPNLLADFDELRALLDGRCPASAHRQLALVAGQLAAVIAFTMVDLGQHQAARRWWRSARAASDRAGDARLAAFVRGRQAVFALYAPAQVLDLAEEAVAAGRGVPCTGVVSGLAARAQALGLMGQADPAREALADLARMFDRLPDDVTRERTSMFAWSEHRLRHVESYVHTRLGDTRRADRAQDAALALYPATQYHLGRAQVRLHRAACLIIDGHVGEGARYATDVLDALPAGHRSVFLQGVARDALSAVPEKARTLPAVVEYRDRLEAQAA